MLANKLLKFQVLNSFSILPINSISNHETFLKCSGNQITNQYAKKKDKKGSNVKEEAVIENVWAIYKGEESLEHLDVFPDWVNDYTTAKCVQEIWDSPVRHPFVDPLDLDNLFANTQDLKVPPKDDPKFAKKSRRQKIKDSNLKKTFFGKSVGEMKANEISDYTGRRFNTYVEDKPEDEGK